MKIPSVRIIKLNAMVSDFETRNASHGIAPTVRTAVLIMNGITYVPHMTKPCFVGPGYIYSDAMNIHTGREFTPSELMAMGARRAYEFLWLTTLARDEQNFSFREADRFSKPDPGAKLEADAVQDNDAQLVIGSANG